MSNGTDWLAGKVEYHFIQTQGVGDVAQDATMTREKADDANAFLVQNTDYYWAEIHPAGGCSKCSEGR